MKQTAPFNCLCSLAATPALMIFRLAEALLLSNFSTKPCGFRVMRAGCACPLIFPLFLLQISQGLVTTMRYQLNYLLLTDENLETWKGGVSYMPKATHSHSSNPCFFSAKDFPLAHWIPSLIRRLGKQRLILLSLPDQLHKMLFKGVIFWEN